MLHAFRIININIFIQKTSNVSLTQKIEQQMVIIKTDCIIIYLFSQQNFHLCKNEGKRGHKAIKYRYNSLHDETVIVEKMFMNVVTNE